MPMLVSAENCGKSEDGRRFPNAALTRGNSYDHRASISDIRLSDLAFPISYLRSIGKRPDDYRKWPVLRDPQEKVAIHRERAPRRP
jgi:hypothetical protein